MFCANTESKVSLAKAKERFCQGRWHHPTYAKSDHTWRGAVVLAREVGGRMGSTSLNGEQTAAWAVHEYPAHEHM